MCLCFCAEIDKIWIEKTLLEEKNVKSPKHDFYHFVVPPLPFSVRSSCWHHDISAMAAVSVISREASES